MDIRKTNLELLRYERVRLDTLDWICGVEKLDGLYPSFSLLRKHIQQSETSLLDRRGIYEIQRLIQDQLGRGRGFDVGYTLTFRQFEKPINRSMSGRFRTPRTRKDRQGQNLTSRHDLTEKQVRRSIKLWLNRLAKAQKDKEPLDNVTFIEHRMNEGRQLHGHGMLIKPRDISMDKFIRQIKSCWQGVWMSGTIDVVSLDDVPGWAGYISKELRGYDYEALDEHCTSFFS